jgi:uncharacterized protein YcbK (DUF882 family)
VSGAHDNGVSWPWRPHRVVAPLALGVALLAGSYGRDRVLAAGDVRTLTFFHTHSEETATVTFRRNGRYDEQGLNQLNWLLRDWRSDETTRMDPRLFDILWELQRELGTASPIHVISAYRSPATNGALRRRSGAVAENSLHMAGKAIDVRLPDVDTAKLRAIAMKAQFGGVGYYPAAEFVHVDTGSVRAWPRMTQEQLAQLFPTGKTVHLPSNGQPLARHDEARAEIAAREAKLASAGVRAGSAVHGRGIAMASLTAPTRFSSEPSPMAGRSPAPGRPQSDPAPVQAVGIATASIAPVPPSPNVAAEFDEAAVLRALFTSPAQEPNVRSSPLMQMAVFGRSDPLPTSAIAASATLALSFDHASDGGLTTTRFQGPAVRPLAGYVIR